MRVVVINPSFPQLTKLATMLAVTDELTAYVHPLVAAGRPWEQRITKLPFVGPVLGKELRRKAIPEGLDFTLVVLAASKEELFRVLLSRLPRSTARVTGPLMRHLSNRRNRLLSNAGASALTDADVVVASHGTALEAFGQASRNGALKVLDYPITHHRFSGRLLAKEAARNPGFVETLQWYRLPEAFERRLDAECELADYILTGSTFAKASFTEEGFAGSKVVAIPYGVDASMFQPRVSPAIDDVFRVLFVGSIGQRKGINYLLEGYEAFAKQDTELILVGNYVGEPKAFLPYENLYKHVSHAPHWKMPDVFSASSVFVFPSLLEGMGLVVLEAMASGVPVITTANGPGDIVRDGIDGYVVPAGDSAAISDRLELLYFDAERRAYMGMKARERSLEFSWERYTRHVTDLLQSTLDARRNAVGEGI